MKKLQFFKGLIIGSFLTVGLWAGIYYAFTSVTESIETVEKEEPNKEFATIK